LRRPDRSSRLSSGAESLVSFGDARIGRIGETGQMPGGWRSEHLDDIEIDDIGSQGHPWIRLRVGFGVDTPGQYAGLGLASYLPAPKAATIALAAEVTLGDRDNITEVLLVVREYEGGGGLLGQAAQSLSLVDEPQTVWVSYTTTTETSVAEPLLMIRRKTVGAVMLTVTLRGLAFGNAEHLSHLRNDAEPLVSFRDARTGRIGEAGQMPSGWRSEHLEDIEVDDIGSQGRPWIRLRVGFGVDTPGQYAGVGLASYLPAPKASTIALAAEVTLGDRDNIAEVLLVIREYESGGGLLGQAAQSLNLVDGPQMVSVSYTMTTETSVAEPLLMIRRKTVGAVVLTVTVRGLAFGNTENYPYWRFSMVGDK